MQKASGGDAVYQSFEETSNLKIRVRKQKK